MLGIDPYVITQWLNIDPKHRSIKQKQRVFNLERYETIKVEVDKLLKARFIRSVNYLMWLSNVMLVKKANG